MEKIAFNASAGIVLVVKFRYASSNDNLFFCSPENIMDVILSKDKNGIEFIEEFDSVNLKFKTVSKKQLLSWIGDDESAKSHYYFKK